MILYKYAKLFDMDVDKACSLDDYTDAAKISSYSLKAVKWAVERDIYPTRDAELLEPTGKLTRAQMALLVTEYEVSILSVKLTGDFILTNEEGEELICRGTELSGDMEVIAYNIIYNGPDMPAGMVLCVRNSDNYYWESLSENTEVAFSVCNKVGYTTVEGCNVEKVQIDAENRMKLAGNEMSYEIVYGNNESEQLEVITSNVE